jgi:hypothetical protein
MKYKKNGYQHDCNLKMFIFNDCKKKETINFKIWKLLYSLSNQYKILLNKMYSKNISRIKNNYNLMKMI